MNPTKVYKSMLLAGMLVSLYPGYLAAEEVTQLDEMLCDHPEYSESKKLKEDRAEETYISQESEKTEDMISQIEVTAQIQVEESALESSAQPPDTRNLEESLAEQEQSEGMVIEQGTSDAETVLTDTSEMQEIQSDKSQLAEKQTALSHLTEKQTDPSNVELSSGIPMDEEPSSQDEEPSSQKEEKTSEQILESQSSELQTPKQNEKLNIEIETGGLPFYYRTVTDYLWNAKTHTYQEHNHGEWINNYQRILIKNRSDRSAALKLSYNSTCEKNVRCLIISQETGEEKLQQEFRICPGEEKIFYLHIEESEGQMKNNGAMTVGKLTLSKVDE